MNYLNDWTILFSGTKEFYKGFLLLFWLNSKRSHNDHQIENIQYTISFTDALQFHFNFTQLLTLL